MNRYKKLQITINEILELQLQDDEIFFAQKVPQKLYALANLMNFPNIDNEEFKRYLAFFQNDIYLDVKRCMLVQNETSHEQREAIFSSIKLHIKPRLKVVEYAFAFYLKDKSLLFKEEDGRQHLPINKAARVKAVQIYDKLLHHHGKTGDNLSNPAAAS